MFFFFQAEDGIRDLTVTGVQTCALPISAAGSAGDTPGTSNLPPSRSPPASAGSIFGSPRTSRRGAGTVLLEERQIGRAACRGRVEISGVAGSFKKKKKKTICVSRKLRTR